MGVPLCVYCAVISSCLNLPESWHKETTIIFIFFTNHMLYLSMTHTRHNSWMNDYYIGLRRIIFCTLSILSQNFLYFSVLFGKSFLKLLEGYSQVSLFIPCPQQVLVRKEYIIKVKSKPVFEYQLYNLLQLLFTLI